MKRHMKPSLALTLSLLLSLVSFPLKAQGQQRPAKFRAETGLIIPGPHRIVRLTVNTGAGDDVVTVRFRQMEYAQGACNSDGVCKLVMASQTTSNSIRLMPGEGAFYDLTDGTSNTILALRGVVWSSSRNARVTVTFINSATGEVEAFMGTTFDDESVQ